MKNILTILLFLTTTIGFSQPDDNGEIELVGIWTLTEFSNPDKFEDTWEFTSDGIFNELKHKAGGGTTWIPDENGTWTLIDKELNIIITGEEIHGEQKLFIEPQIMKFEISKKGDDLILKVVVNGSATKLRLTKS